MFIITLHVWHEFYWWEVLLITNRTEHWSLFYSVIVIYIDFIYSVVIVHSFLYLVIYVSVIFSITHEHIVINFKTISLGSLFILEKLIFVCLDVNFIIWIFSSDWIDRFWLDRSARKISWNWSVLLSSFLKRTVQFWWQNVLSDLSW